MIEGQGPDLPYYVIEIPALYLSHPPLTKQVYIYVNGMVKLDGFVHDLRKVTDLRKQITTTVINKLKTERDGLARVFYASILDIMSSCQSPLSKTSCTNSGSTSNVRESLSM